MTARVSHVQLQTERRLRWLYGETALEDRRAMTEADVAAWNRLGRNAHSAPPPIMPDPNPGGGGHKRQLQILADYNGGMTGEQVGTRYGITRQRVSQILSRLRRDGYTVRAELRRPITEEERERRRQRRKDRKPHPYASAVISLRKSGYEPRDIVKFTGLSRGVVLGILFRAGLCKSMAPIDQRHQVPA